jgi:hypothetical protein
MAADWFFGALKHPLIIALWLGVVAVASMVTYRGSPALRAIRPARLFVGYVVALAVCVVLSAASAWISPEEAAAVWHVSPDRYREAVTREFVNTLAGSAFLSGLGIAFVGVPVIARLARQGRAQIGWVLLASAAISAVFSLALSVLALRLGSLSWVRDFLSLLSYSLPSHLLLSLGFSLGMGLPWKVRRGGATLT